MHTTWKEQLKTNEHLNKNELAKLEKDGLEILKELELIQTKKMADVAPFDIERLKWAGIYAQRPKDGHFLIRIKLPSGKLNATQAAAIAKIANTYGKGEIQLTIRQCIQIHNISIHQLKEVYDAIVAAGLTSIEGCGDVPRNILGNPLMGVDPKELFDTTSLVEEANHYLVGNPEFSNLPRKFKLSISANPNDAGFAGINDLAFVPAVYQRNNTTINGFHVYVGGGLSTEPHLAKKLPIFVKPEETLTVIRGCATIFRDYGYRQNRGHCRLKYLVEDLGVSSFTALLEDITHPFCHGGQEKKGVWNYGRFHGFHKQKQQDLYYVGANIPSGFLTADDLYAFARLSTVYGDGSLRLTNSQCVVLINIPKTNIRKLKKEDLFEKYPYTPGHFTGYAASCTGNKYCNFAPIETKKKIADITNTLEECYPDFPIPLRINLTGCVHSCAHPQIADIGLTGAKIKVNGIMTDGFKIVLGGRLGKHAAFGTALQGILPAEKIIPFICLVLDFYLENRTHKKEPFYAFVERIGIHTFQQFFNTICNS